MANNFCENCGSQLVFQDGKLVCPTCGSSFAVNYDQSDVERARIATREERERANAERLARMDATRRAIQQQQAADDERRRRQSQSKRLIIVGIVVLFMFFSPMLFQIPMLAVACNARRTISPVVNKLSEKTNPSFKKSFFDIDSDKVVADTTFLKNAIESGAYYVKTDSVRNNVQIDNSTENAYMSGEPEFVEAYLVRYVGYAEIYEIYRVEFTSEKTEKTAWVYYPAAMDITIGSDGKVQCDYRASLRNYMGYMSKEELVEQELDAMEDAAVSKLGIPEKVLSDIAKKK
ncbi:MAG: hypothetical protein IKG93_02950 [Clostridiales bacterium]|nr:hypothetical protein [Clostridiales bacterium]